MRRAPNALGVPEPRKLVGQRDTAQRAVSGARYRNESVTTRVAAQDIGAIGDATQ